MLKLVRKTNDVDGGYACKLNLQVLSIKEKDNLPSGWMNLRTRNRPVLQPEPVNTSGDRMSILVPEKEEVLPYAACYSSESPQVMDVGLQRLRLSSSKCQCLCHCNCDGKVVWSTGK